MREKLTPSAWKRMVMERTTPGYGGTMEKLRDVDQRIHDWTKDLGALLADVKRAKKSKQLDAGRLVDITKLLVTINNRLKGITEIGSPIEKSHEKYLNEFQEEVSEDIAGKVATAGFLEDFWNRLKNEWLAEKLLTPEEKKRNAERKRVILSLVGTAEQALHTVEKKLKDMEEARASGNIGSYISALREISVVQQNFDSEYATVYNMYFKDIADSVVEEHQKMDEEAESEKAESEEAETAPETDVDLGDLEEDSEEDAAETERDRPSSATTPSEIGTAPTQYSPGVPYEGAPAGSVGVEEARPASAPRTEPSGKPSHVPTGPGGPFTAMSPGQQVGAEGLKSEELEMPSQRPQTWEDVPVGPSGRREVRIAMLKAQHQHFVEELKKAAATYNDPYILAAMLAKYSGHIEEQDPESSMKLLAIVEGVVDER
jgi:hypothetical protein